MLHIGTSGYNYPEWRGAFYPEGLPAARMLGYYAERFPAVEINYTFYRMPTEAVVRAWVAGTPDGFAFVLKAPQRITHMARLRECGDVLARFLAVADTLGDRRAPFLFQLPPNFKADVARLEAFLDLLPPGTRAAFEFRHTSWFTEDVYEALQRRNLALCIADSEKLETPVVRTADYAYFRLRDEGYEAADITEWAETIREFTATATDTFVFFKHEKKGVGPAFAVMLRERLARQG